MKVSKKAFLIHGAYMSSKNFTELKTYLEKSGIKTLAVDLNPESSPRLTYQDYIKKAKKALEAFGPSTVIGISMGGMIATELLGEKNLKKAILLSTPVGKEPSNSKYSMLKLKLLPQVLTGKIRIDPKELTCNIEDKTCEYLEKHKRYENVSTMKESRDFQKFFNNIKQSKKPIIMAYGDKDYTVSIDEARKLKNVKIKIFENMSHFLIHEKERQKVYEFIKSNI